MDDRIKWLLMFFLFVISFVLLQAGLMLYINFIEIEHVNTIACFLLNFGKGILGMAIYSIAFAAPLFVIQKMAPSIKDACKIISVILGIYSLYVFGTSLNQFILFKYFELNKSSAIRFYLLAIGLCLHTGLVFLMTISGIYNNEVIGTLDKRK